MSDETALRRHKPEARRRSPVISRRSGGLDIDLIVLTGLAERNSTLKAGKTDASAKPVDYLVLEHVGDAS